MYFPYTDNKCKIYKFIEYLHEVLDLSMIERSAVSST